jgi:dTDP-4-dehydrorhamnose reductase
VTAFVAVTGANGQLGRAVVAELEKLDFAYRAFTRDDLEITDSSKVASSITSEFTAVINCAAYTNVDGAESHPDAAFAVNEKGTSNIAARCSELGIRMIHVSTDYVFDGMTETALSETDPASPRTEYGKSKLAGEQAALSINPSNTWVVRTAWLYSDFGNNFANKILRKAKNGEALQVVNDQFSSPTSVVELARGLVSIATSKSPVNVGVYHCVNSGVASWHSFALALIKAAGLQGVQIQPVDSDAFPTAAQRPRYSVLDTSKWQAAGLPKMSGWEQALQDFQVSKWQEIQGNSDV